MRAHLTRSIEHLVVSPERFLAEERRRIRHLAAP
jgi:hypothetical protein